MFYSNSRADQDSALASRRETLLSEQGCLCQALKRCPASAFTREHTNLCSCPRASRARRQLGDAGEAEGSRASPPPAPPAVPRCTHPPSPPFQGPESHGSYLAIISSINTERRQGALSKSWPHETASSARRGFQGSRGLSTGWGNCSKRIIPAPQTESLYPHSFKQLLRPKMKRKQESAVKLLTHAELGSTLWQVLLRLAPKPGQWPREGGALSWGQSTNRLCPSQPGLPKPQDGKHALAKLRLFNFERAPFLKLKHHLSNLGTDVPDTV